MASVMPPSPPITPPFSFAYHASVPSHPSITNDRPERHRQGAHVSVTTPTPLATSGSALRHTSHRPIPFHTPHEQRQVSRTLSLNPILRPSTTRQNQSRSRFLDGVRQRRDDVLWGTRGERILQMDFLEQQRRWEDERMRAAPPEAHDEYDDISMDVDMVADGDNDASDRDTNKTYQLMMPSGEIGGESLVEHEEIDALLRAEARELDELAAFQEERQAQRQGWECRFGQMSEPDQGGKWANDQMQRQLQSSSPVYGTENDEDFEVALVGLVDAGREPDLGEDVEMG